MQSYNSIAAPSSSTPQMLLPTANLEVVTAETTTTSGAAAAAVQDDALTPTNESNNAAPTVASLIDFDFNMPTRYFKSSFARSLSMPSDSDHYCRSLDFTNLNQQQQQEQQLLQRQQYCDLRSMDNYTSVYNNNDLDELPPRLPQRANRSNNGSNHNTALKPKPSIVYKSLNRFAVSRNMRIDNTTTHSAVYASSVGMRANNDVNAVQADSAIPPALPARRTPVSVSNYHNSLHCNHNININIDMPVIKPPLPLECLENISNNNTPHQQQQISSRKAANRGSVGGSSPSSSPSPISSSNTSPSRSPSGSGSGSGSCNSNRIGTVMKNFKDTKSQSYNNSNSAGSIERNLWPKAEHLEQKEMLLTCIVRASDEYHFNSLDEAEHQLAQHQQRQRQQQHDANKLTALDFAAAANANGPSSLSSAVQKQQQQQQQRAATPALPPAIEMHENGVNVEAAILKNQVNTLEWQLKQADVNNRMYHGVLEEVARFLDRFVTLYLQNKRLQATRNEQILRSRSMHHISDIGNEETLAGDTDACGGSGIGIGISNVDKTTSSYLRGRSSTHIINEISGPNTSAKTAGAAAKCKTAKSGMILNDNVDNAFAQDNSYTAFKDFTWRRVPKKPNEGRCKPAIDDVEQKLHEEAFRLSRTVQNVLVTSMHQPDLMTGRHSMDHVCKTAATSALSMHNGAAQLGDTVASACALTNSAKMDGGPKNSTLAGDMLFLRASNVRGSRLSLRSSTDSSVHSTTSSAASSSSKMETDEEHSTFSAHTPKLLLNNKPIQVACCTTEDESGFSSISSFQDVGIPLCSTFISDTSTPIRARPVSGRKANPRNDPHSMRDLSMESRNSTLKAIPPPSTGQSTPPNAIIGTAHPNNVVGVPLHEAPAMQHRWDLPTKTHHNAAQNQRFSTLSNEDSNPTVLWV